MSKKIYALSIRQPWATLIMAGIKTIEIRSWATQIREKIAIHASSIIDDHPPAWKLVPTDYQQLAQLRGGVIGVAELVQCRLYRTLTEFSQDNAEHWNEMEWFSPPRFGFVLERPRIVSFRKMKGNARFFFVSDPENGQV